MSSPQKQPQRAASRWGFLQQAVASVESRLDTILGEEDEIPKKAPTAQLHVQGDNVPSKRPSMEVSRSGASTPANDRLQERLAKAMAKKGGSRPETPTTAADEEKAIDIEQAEKHDGGLDETTVPQELGERSSSLDQDRERDPIVPTSDSLAADTLQPSTLAPMEPSGPTSVRTSTDAANEQQSRSSVRPSGDSQARNDATLLQLQLDHEAAQRQMQEDINGYVERMDTLQAKLLYLTKEAADSAKKAAAAAQNGTVEKKLLEKDEKIALLMDEGQKLSKTEMKHLTTIKKLRAQITASSKEQDGTKLRAEKAERSLRQMEDRAKRAEAATKRAEQTLSSAQNSTSDFEAVRKERDALNSTLADIKTQLSRANARNEAVENKAESEQLEKERKRNAELQDDIVSSKVERELAEEKLRREIKDLNASLEREKEHSKAMETEMLGEQATLESKLESFRSRAEEASSGDHGEVNAKLLRQIETLQNQYAIASQNWQGIESSLLGRITTLEKERDEIAAQESDVRRKMREVTLKAKKTERELVEVQTRLPELEKSHSEFEQEFQRSARKISQLEADLKRGQTELEDQKLQAERDLVRRIEEEKTKWAALQAQRTDSPGASIRKGSALGVDVMYPLQTERGISRRPSILQHHDSNTPPRQQSLASLKGLQNGGIPETPSIVTSQDADEYFNNIPATPASQSHATSPRLHDLISTSTVGAGPSVQLVERMSANVRRLESEKAASKDEIARLTSQRDESRNEVVNLMREVEEKRKIEERLNALETEHKGLEDRHKTTLEMLGERSEQVEELKADILDVKQMYRQLADQMK